MTTLIAVVSDVHAGSTIALCPPKISLDDGGHYEASKAQSWLWQEWLAYWDWVSAIRDDEHASLFTVFNGDLVDGNHHKTTQILTGNPTAQAAVLDEAMRIPLALKPDKMFFVRGTEAHVGQSASSEERIALGLWKDGRPVVKCQDTGCASHWHLRMQVNTTRLDFAHHGRIGQRPWTKPNVVANLAAEIFYEHAKDGLPHPHVAVRSHFHRHVDTYDQHPVRVIQTPCWQLATSYVHKVAPETLADVGGVLIIVRDESFEVKNFIRKPGRPTVWVA